MALFFYVVSYYSGHYVGHIGRAGCTKIVLFDLPTFVQVSFEIVDS